MGPPILVSLTWQCPHRSISFKESLLEVQVQESSLELLKGCLGDIINATVDSVDKCPLPIRVAFKQLLSGFLFLCFFTPAVLTPKLFRLREQHTEPCVDTGRVSNHLYWGHWVPVLGCWGHWGIHQHRDVGVPMSPLLWLAVPGCSHTHGTVLLGQWSDLGDPV
ncbi:RasGAP-activating-like protein 1, partial [Lamprotornis superbus]